MAQNARTTTSPIHIWTFNTPSSASTFYVVGVFPINIPRQFNAAASTLIICSHFNFVRRVSFISSFNKCIALIIPVLATFLQLEYQGNNDQKKNPFATHPTTMHVAVSSSVVYYIAYIVLLRFPRRRFAVVAHHCLTWSGHASVASLASVFFPNWFSPFVYTTFVLISVGDLLCRLYHKLVVEEDADFQVYRRRFRRLLNNMCRVVGNSSAQWPQILPV